MQVWTRTTVCVWVLEVCLRGSVGDTNKSQRDFRPKRHQAMGPVTSEVPRWMTEPMGGHQRQLSLPATHWELTRQNLTYLYFSVSSSGKFFNALTSLLYLYS